MRAEYALCHRASFEQGEAQQHRIADATPNRPDGIAACRDALHQHRINRHAYKDQQTLETNSKQGFEVVLSHAANFTVGERSHGDEGQAGEQIYFNHAPIDDDENNNVQRKHGNVNKERLEPQAQQGADFHRLQGRLSSMDALMSVEPRTSPAALAITLWDISNTAMTILNMLERMRMAAAVLKIHLKKIQ